MLFRFGKSSTIKTMIVLSILVSILGSCLKIEDKYIWDVFYESLNRVSPKSPILREIRKNPELIQRKVERTVDRAIENYYETPEYQTPTVREPVYSESPIDASVCYTDECRALGGEIRLCAPWLESCPIENQSK